ncbi:transcriptional regulator [Longispora fulva]|uniref:DNA-binding GntR family transcriptional regulator n=1 Tax=Longispora fulva TaxID=619741 RepID=A0A8J7GM75_9ACTN|nr:GntR family transcriptional regulator [Longispora fulva]MBG6134143.1 DNA-binding GntR family transcriptional regulator [Longispora fulva]GIG62516.1 transcriptional regulator [Longispora fulva]
MEPVAPLIRLDRSSPVPLYFQVAQRLEELIETGQLATGARLENEIALADQLGLARPTMRQAIQYLVDKGMLVRKRGVGTQVAHTRIRRQVELSSLYDDLDRAQRQPRTDVLSFGVVPASEEVAAALHIPPDTDVVAIERLRYAQDEPLALLHNYLPVGLADITAEQLQAHGLYQILRDAGVRLRVADQTIGARRATAAEAQLLTESRGAPLLTMARTAYDHGGRAVEYGAHVYRASLYSFELSLVAR